VKLDKKSYVGVYNAMISGCYSEKVLCTDTGKKELATTTRLVRQGCTNVGISFDDFMVYARARKLKDNKVDNVDL